MQPIAPTKKFKLTNASGVIDGAYLKSVIVTCCDRIFRGAIDLIAVTATAIAARRAV